MKTVASKNISNPGNYCHQLLHLNRVNLKLLVAKKAMTPHITQTLNNHVTLQLIMCWYVLSIYLETK